MSIKVNGNLAMKRTNIGSDGFKTASILRLDIFITDVALIVKNDDSNICIIDHYLEGMSLDWSGLAVR
jgi:hypothetical protein